MRTLLMFRGAPGCGKSTFIKNHGLEEYSLSADNIRLMCQAPIQKADGTYGISQSNDAYVWKLLFEMLELRMKRGEFVVIDATNSTTTNMSRYKHLVELYRYRALIVDMTDVPIDVCKQRNANRLPEYKRVPEFVIDYSYKKFEEQEIPKWIKKIKPEEVDDAIQLKPLDYNKWNKIHHIGDIHGSLDCLKEYLGDIQDDEFYIFCGDYCDRGTQNVETLLYMMELAQRDNVLLLTGNHERHLWDYSKDQPSASKEFNDVTAKQFDEAGISKKEIRKFYRKLAQIAYYTYDNKTIVVTHGGISKMPNNLMLMATEQFIKGVGDYNETETAEDTFTKSTMKYRTTDLYQIHGHRNLEKNMIWNGAAFNLEGEVEFGGCLRCLTLRHDVGFEMFYTKNNNFNAISYEPDHLDDIPLEKIIQSLRDNKYIREKQLENNVSSFNFSPQAFKKKIWDEETIRTRGLFINTNLNKIVARSYNKFFNIDEMPLTKLGNLELNFEYPVSVYRKYNGYLGLLGYNPETDELMYCSKSTNEGEFAQWFKEYMESHYSKEELIDIKAYIRDNNVTFVFEVILPEKDPHIIEYEKDKVVLLDIIYNTMNFKHIEYSKLKVIGECFNMEVKRREYVFDSWESFMDWYAYYIDNDPQIEGYVIEDDQGFMTKIKTDYYNSWKKLRYVVSEVYEKGYILKPTILKPYEMDFYNWLIKQNKEVQGSDIITIRNMYKKRMLKIERKKLNKK